MIFNFILLIAERALERDYFLTGKGGLYCVCQVQLMKLYSQGSI